MDDIRTVLDSMLRQAQSRSGPGAFQGQMVSQEQERYLCDPDCPVCGGMGWIRRDLPITDPMFGKMLPCPNADPFKRYARVMALDPSELSLSWSSIVPVPELAEAIEAVKRTLERGYGWVYLHGPYGVGKTLILKVALVEYVRQSRNPAAYTRMVEIIDHMRAAYETRTPNEQSEARLDMWAGLPFLAIDEFDRVRQTEYSAERQFVLMDRRYEDACLRKSITIMASNCKPDDLEGYLVDRIYDGRFEVVNVLAPSARRAMSY